MKRIQNLLSKTKKYHSRNRVVKFLYRVWQQTYSVLKRYRKPLKYPNEQKLYAYAEVVPKNKWVSLPVVQDTILWCDFPLIF